MKFEQVLEPTYYNNGFFNVKVEFDRFIRNTNGPIAIQLGYGQYVVPGRVDRKANLNNTARIYGRTKLKNWFQSNFGLGQSIIVDIRAPEHIVLLPK